MTILRVRPLPRSPARSPRPHRRAARRRTNELA
jgi:hypothetical protein